MPLLDHVGLPIRPEDLIVGADRLRMLGATIIGRGRSASRESIWLELGNVEVHLIATPDARVVSTGETFSPHLCVRVGSTDELQALTNVENVGVWKAGTLDDCEQTWIALAPSLVIEVQSPPL